MNQTAAPRHPPQARFTEKQGQYLAFIRAYTKINGWPPAEADMQRHFWSHPANRSPDGSQSRPCRVDRAHPREASKYPGACRTGPSADSEIATPPNRRDLHGKTLNVRGAPSKKFSRSRGVVRISSFCNFVTRLAVRKPRESAGNCREGETGVSPRAVRGSAPGCPVSAAPALTRSM